MLFADKRNLETNLQVSLLKIRDKELQFYVGNCIASTLARPSATTLPCAPLTAVPTVLTVGTQSAVLAGFAYNGMIQVDIPDGASEFLQAAWLVTSCCAMGFEMICLVSTSFCVMFGPGLALRGGRRAAAPPRHRATAPPRHRATAPPRQPVPRCSTAVLYRAAR